MTRLLFIGFLSILLSSCAAYRTSIMFQTDGSINKNAFETKISDTKNNYKLEPGDILSVRVFTDKGERIIDPNNDFMMSRFSSDGLNMGMGGQQFNNIPYIIQSDGRVQLPLIDYINLEGKTLKQADSLLSKYYADFYSKPYVITEIQNRRAVLFIGNVATIVPLANENMTVVEVIAAGGGVDLWSKVDNIRLIRGDLNDPSVQIINLSTIEGMKNSTIIVEPNDIIYVEPVLRVANRATRDIAPYLGLITNIITLTLVLQNNFANN